MNPSSTDTETLYTLFGSVFDGTISEENQRLLESSLASSAAARKLWFEFCDVECCLAGKRECASSGGMEASKIAPLQFAANSPKKRASISEYWSGLAWAAAAAVVFGFSLSQTPLRSLRDPGPAIFVGTHDALWASPSETFDPGDELRSGHTLELLSGSVELKFRGGAVVSLYAPAIFQATSGNECFLKYGSLRALAQAKGSKGFTVQTPTARIVDVGTEFVASAFEDGQSRVEVKSGEVYVHLPWNADAKRLLVGETLSTQNVDQRVSVRLESGDGTEVLRFPSIEAPSTFETPRLKNEASFARILGGENSEAPIRLANIEEGRMLVDLGRSVSVTKINAYSWGSEPSVDKQRTSAAQNFELYGIDSYADPKAEKPLTEQGWEFIGRVDSDSYFGRNASSEHLDRQACSFTSTSGCLGQFRYLLCVPIRRSPGLALSTVKPALNLFDVYAQPWTF
jgi:hypothetical protein